MGITTYPASAGAILAGWAGALVIAIAPPSFAQTSPPPSRAPSTELPPLPPSAQPPAPAPGYPPGSQSPGYQQPGQSPSAPPSYGQQPGGAYAEPPPPPKRHELQWSIRVNPLDLIFGRMTAEFEYAFWGPFSVVVGPQYVFTEPALDRQLGLKASGFGVYGELGFWVEGRPLRGYFLKAHAGHSSVTVQGLRDLTVPATRLGALFGSQSIYGGWFTLSYGIGVVYDTQSQDRTLVVGTNAEGGEVTTRLAASGLFGNGWDILTQLAIGGSF